VFSGEVPNFLKLIIQNTLYVVSVRVIIIMTRKLDTSAREQLVKTG
jgi:hypothetical protein